MPHCNSQLGRRSLFRLLACLWLCCVPSAGQGNRRSSATVLGSTSTFMQLQALYRNSRQWNQAYRASPKSACSKSSSKSGSKAANLCAGSTNSKEALTQYYQLLLSASPRAYSSTDRQQTGGLQLVSPPGSQDPCQTCTAFAVAAAGETAIATALGVDASECSISVQALFFCSTPITRGCSSGWTLPAALEELQQRGSSLPTAACLPYKPGFRPEDADRNRLCTGSCSTASPFARQGSFSFVQIDSAWEAQSHIRQHGAVLTPFDLYPGFDAFFRNASNAKAVYQPPPGAVSQENHAVLLVGYDNALQFWLARNSWGVDWGDGGLFRVAFDSCGVLTPGSEAYGVIWTPKLVPDAVKLIVTPAGPQHPDCYWYKARPGDYLSRVARLAGNQLEQFMLDNTAAVKDLDAPIAGLQLLLCKPNPDSIIDATKPVDKQLQSLLKIKAFIDTTGVLKEWSSENGADGGYCRGWRGVTCTEGGKVVEGVNLWDGTVSGLQGVLPPATAFDGLPGLRHLTIGDQPGINGALPSDWSRLQQLQDIRLGNNSLTGTLPPSWAELKRLRVLYLFSNKLRGPLPDSFKSLTSLVDLGLNVNSLSGSLPPSWNQMQALQVLKLFNNKLHGPLPDAWGGMAALEVLALETNALTGCLPPSWGQLRRLRVFSAFANKLRGPLPDSFKDLDEALAILDLSECSLTGSLPPSWGQMRALKILHLHTNTLRGPLPDAWSAMAALEELGLHLNALTSTLPPSWSQMQALKILYLHKNKLRGSLPDAWSGMAALEDLGLFANELTGSLPPSWGRLSRLRFFTAFKNKLRGPLPDSFKDLEALTMLDFSENSLTGLLPPSWAKLLNLTFLALWSNKLRGSLPDSFKSLTKLEVLRLHKNGFSGVVPPSWNSMTWLKDVFLWNNPQLHGCLPTSWEKQMLGFQWQANVYERTNITGFC